MIPTSIFKSEDSVTGTSLSPCMMVAAASVLLITKKRMGRE